MHGEREVHGRENGGIVMYAVRPNRWTRETETETETDGYRTAGRGREAWRERKQARRELRRWVGVSWRG